MFLILPLFPLPWCQATVQLLMLVGLLLSFWGQTQSEEVKGYSINLAVMNSTSISPSLYKILVSILCPCQEVIAEDARESLPSYTSEPTMVTWLRLADVLHTHIYIHSCGALWICKYAASPIIICLLTWCLNLSCCLLCCMQNMHPCMFDRLLIFLLWFIKAKRTNIDDHICLLIAEYLQ